MQLFTATPNSNVDSVSERYIRIVQLVALEPCSAAKIKNQRMEPRGCSFLFNMDRFPKNLPTIDLTEDDEQPSTSSGIQCSCPPVMMGSQRSQKSHLNVATTNLRKYIRFYDTLCVNRVYRRSFLLAVFLISSRYPGSLWSHQ